MQWRVTAVFLLFSFALPAASQDAAPPSDRVTADPAKVQLIRPVHPTYPPLARQARIQGTVVLKIVIAKSGDVQDVQLVSGHPMLAPAAIAAVKQWKYQPYLVNGDPADVETAVQVNFKIADDTSALQGGVPAQGSAGSSSETVGLAAPRVRVSEAVMRSFRIVKVDPIYPPSAIQEALQGQVTLDVLIDKSGDVAKISVMSSHPVFAQPAIDAVKQWRYTPYLLNGEPVDVQTIVRMNFTLPPERDSEGTVADAPLIADAALTAPGASRPLRVRVSSGVAGKLLLAKVAPLYPNDAREARIQGTVILKVNIDPEGNVYNAELISGHPLLAPAAIEAVKQWKYRPYLLNGSPIEVETQVQVNFVLTGN